MPGQRNPAETPGFARWITELWDALKAVRKDVRELQTARQSYPQKATVTAFVSGPLCTVQFESGEVLVGVGRLASYPTPVVGDTVAVLIGPFATVVLGKYA